MFVVAGVTGNTGSATAASLLAAGLPVKVLVRGPEKGAAWARRGAEVAVGDLADPRSLALAFEGADAAFVLNPPAYASPDLFARATSLAESILHATRRAPPGRLLVLSSVGAHLPSGTGIIGTNRIFEQVLGNVRCAVTFLRPAYFFENWRLGAQAAARDGVLTSFLAPVERAIPMVGAADIGRMAAAAMRDRSAPRVIELTGPRDYSPRDAADACGAVLRGAVRAVAVPESDWSSILSRLGFSRRTIEGWEELFRAFNSGAVGFEGSSPTIRRGTTRLEEAVSDMAIAEERFSRQDSV